MAKKEKTTIALPKAWQSVKHQKETAQTKANIDDISSLIVGIIIAILVLFILLGGINQRAFINFIFDWSHNAGETISAWINGANIQITDNGIYLDPTNTKFNTTNTENTNSENSNNINSENTLSENNLNTDISNSEQSPND